MSEINPKHLQQVIKLYQIKVRFLKKNVQWNV